MQVVPAACEAEAAEASRLMVEPIFAPPAHFLDVYELKGVVGTYLEKEDLVNYSLASKHVHESAAPILQAWRVETERAEQRAFLDDVPIHLNKVKRFERIRLMSTLFAIVVGFLSLLLPLVVDVEPSPILFFGIFFFFERFFFVVHLPRGGEPYPKHCCDGCFRFFLPLAYLAVIIGAGGLTAVGHYTTALTMEREARTIPAECVLPYLMRLKLKPFGPTKNQYAYVTFSFPQLWNATGPVTKIQKNYNTVWLTNDVNYRQGEVDLEYHYIMFTGGPQNEAELERLCSPFFNDTRYRNETWHMLRSNLSTEFAHAEVDRWSSIKRPTFAMDWPGVPAVDRWWGRRLQSGHGAFQLIVFDDVTFRATQERLSSAKSIPSVANGIYARGPRNPVEEYNFMVSATIQILFWWLVLLIAPIVYDLVRHFRPFYIKWKQVEADEVVLENAADECRVYGLDVAAVLAARRAEAEEEAEEA